MTTPMMFEYWCQLTPELKLECVKHMNFIENNPIKKVYRLRLRATSKMEKSVVDSKEIHVTEINITDRFDYLFMEFELGSNEKYKIVVENEEVRDEKLVPLLSYFLRNGVIGKLVSYESKMFSDENLAYLLESAPYRITKLSLSGLTGLKELLLRNSTAGLKSVSLINSKIEPLDVKSMFGNEDLNQVKNWYFGDYIDTDISQKMAENWIENQVQIGTNCIMRRAPINDFAKAFEDRIVEKKGWEVRIRTEDFDKHILLRERFPVIIMLVIPSDLDEADYIKFTKKHVLNNWI